MRLEWIEDLLAVIDAGTLTRAAEARLLTQPAFSRRLRTIEAHLGVELVDRLHRPARLRPAVLAQEPLLRELASGLRDLGRALRQSDAARGPRVVVAAQHAITTAMAPRILRALLPNDIHFRLRSANREECYALVMTRNADLTLCYQTGGDRLASGETLLEEIDLGTERFIPVFARSDLTELQSTFRRNALPVVSYPRDVFLGRRMEQDILPRLPITVIPISRAETALTLAALQLAAAGLGVAWVPRSLACRNIQDGTLADLSDWLPSSDLLVAALRLKVPKDRSEAEELVWAGLAGLGESVGKSALSSQ